MRAEELRRLLDVVAGLAPDDLGRISEPIVKDELAIVEFLTQRANDPDSQSDSLNNSAPIPPYDHVLASGRRTTSFDSSRDQRPTDLTRISPRSTADDAAWSFVAPGMASIDVHAPFATGAGSERSGISASSRATPGPLRPPPTRNSLAAPAAHNRSPDIHHIRHRSSSAISASQDPLQSTYMRPQPLPSPQQSIAGSLQDVHHNPPNAMMNGYDDPMDVGFGYDGNVDAWWNDIGNPLSMNAQNTPGNFNPFALAQFGEGEVDNSK